MQHDQVASLDVACRLGRRLFRRLGPMRRHMRPHHRTIEGLTDSPESVEHAVLAQKRLGEIPAPNPVLERARRRNRLVFPNFTVASRNG